MFCRALFGVRCLSLYCMIFMIITFLVAPSNRWLFFSFFQSFIFCTQCTFFPFYRHFSFFDPTITNIWIKSCANPSEISVWQLISSGNSIKSMFLFLNWKTETNTFQRGFCHHLGQIHVKKSLLLQCNVRQTRQKGDFHVQMPRSF